MSDTTRLPHLLRLMEDDSMVVQEALAREFSDFGPGLTGVLAGLPVPPDEAQLERIEQLIGEHRRQELRDEWPGWFEVSGFYGRLEEALSLIAQFQCGPGYPRSLSLLLDDLADEFKRRGGTMDERTLARFLFNEKGLEGDRSNYYHPHNSNLVHVIETQRGLPISLACIYMLVGHRLGFSIGGCNWPHHFYARMKLDGQVMLVDCFRGGRFMDRDTFLKMQGPSREAAESVLDEDAGVKTIVARILGNLIRAYQHLEHPSNARLMLELLRDLGAAAGRASVGLDPLGPLVVTHTCCNGLLVDPRVQAKGDDDSLVVDPFRSKHTKPRCTRHCVAPRGFHKAPQKFAFNSIAYRVAQWVMGASAIRGLTKLR